MMEIPRPVCEDLDAEILKEKAQTIELPATVREVLQILDQDDVDFSRLESVLRADPGLVMRILAVANSPFYGFSGEIVSLRHACMVLGLHTIRHIIMGVGVLEAFPAAAGNHLDVKHFRQHSAATGAVAQVLSGAVDLDPDKAFTAGLLHDIGKMVLDVHFPNAYARVLIQQCNMSCRARDAELSVLGMDHAQVGAVVAEAWKLPAQIRDAIGRHHDVAGVDCPLMAALVHVADYTAHRVHHAVGQDGDPLPELRPEALLWLGLDAGALDVRLADIKQAVVAASAWVE